MVGHERMKIANGIIQIIASHGRRFFSLSADRREPLPTNLERVSCFVERNGRLYFLDRYTQQLVSVCRDGRWLYFTEGGTLQSVVKMLRDYILGKRKDVDIRYFGPWPSWVCDGDLWGYGEDMEKVRSEIAKLLEGTCGI